MTRSEKVMSLLFVLGTLWLAMKLGGCMFGGDCSFFDGCHDYSIHAGDC